MSKAKKYPRQVVGTDPTPWGRAGPIQAAAAMLARPIGPLVKLALSANLRIPAKAKPAKSNVGAQPLRKPFPENAPLVGGEPISPTWVDWPRTRPVDRPAPPIDYQPGAMRTHREFSFLGLDEYATAPSRPMWPTVESAICKYWWAIVPLALAPFAPRESFDKFAGWIFGQSLRVFGSIFVAYLGGIAYKMNTEKHGPSGGLAWSLVFVLGVGLVFGVLDYVKIEPECAENDVIGCIQSDDAGERITPERTHGQSLDDAARSFFIWSGLLAAGVTVAKLRAQPRPGP